jgi:hypothetical protein
MPTLKLGYGGTSFLQGVVRLPRAGKLAAPGSLYCLTFSNVGIGVLMFRTCFARGWECGGRGTYVSHVVGISVLLRTFAW